MANKQKDSRNVTLFVLWTKPTKYLKIITCSFQIDIRPRKGSSGIPLGINHLISWGRGMYILKKKKLPENWKE